MKNHNESKNLIEILEGKDVMMYPKRASPCKTYNTKPREILSLKVVVKRDPITLKNNRRISFNLPATLLES